MDDNTGKQIGESGGRWVLYRLKNLRLVHGALAATMLLLFVEGIDASDGLSIAEQYAVGAFAVGFPFSVMGLFIAQLHEEESFSKVMSRRPFWDLVVRGGFLSVAYVATLLQIRATLSNVVDGAPGYFGPVTLTLFFLTATASSAIAIWLIFFVTYDTLRDGNDDD